MTTNVTRKSATPSPKVGEKYKCVVEGWVCDVGETMAIESVDYNCADYITEKGLKGCWGFTTYPNDFELVSTEPEQSKPLLGLRPWHIADAERVVEILDAMKRYTAECKPIPEEWMEELIEKVVIDYEQ